MFIKPRFSFLHLVKWTMPETIKFALYATLITFLYDSLNLKFIQLPWPPIALLGTAVAFIIGFQNNATYERVKNARINVGENVQAIRQWCNSVGVMINTLRAKEGMKESDLTEVRLGLIHKSLAWITSIRHAMRVSRQWETNTISWASREWTKNIYIPERVTTLDQDLAAYLSQDELEFVLSKDNKASAVISLITKDIEELHRDGFIWEFNYLHLHGILKQMYASQGKTERMKSFPYPRQYVTLSYYLVWVLVLLLPLGLLPTFNQLDITLHARYGYFEHTFIWLTVPFCTVVSWAYHTIQKIGLLGENPFEGTVNDVPISSLTRSVEIEVLQMAGVEVNDLPSRFPIVKDVEL